MTLLSSRESDKPRATGLDGSAAMIGIIGVAQTVSAVGEIAAKVAYASMHFNMEFEVEWVLIFLMKTMENIHIEAK